jgi:hypothetical protein
LREALRKGEESGPGEVVTKELMDKILKEAIARAESGEPVEYDPDVIGPGDDEPWGDAL